MADKTYAQLTAATSIATGDLLASYSGVSGPLKSVAWSLIVSTMQTALGAVYAQLGNNLSDLSNIGQARANLGLGNSATRNVGQVNGMVAAGDDSRFTSLNTLGGNALALATTAENNAAAALAMITSGTAAPGALATGVLYFQYSP